MAAKFNLVDRLEKDVAKNEKLKKKGQEMVKTAEKNLKGLRSIARAALRKNFSK